MTNKRIILIHGYGQLDGLPRAATFSNEDQLKVFIKETSTCPVIAFWINKEDICMTYEQMMRLRND
jgi:hypothetical protein